MLSIRKLSISFNMYDKIFKQVKYDIISDLNIEINSGEIFAIVGASGSGKSILAHAIFGLLPSNALVEGEVLYKGERVNKAMLGRELALIPQSVSYLDPLMKVGKQVQGHKNYELEQKRVFEKYGLDEDVANMYPHQLSGGMARRVLIACAIISGANVIIADEPTANIDSKNASITISDFKDLAKQGKSIILITHDIDVAIEVADKIAVFYDGTVVEVANSNDFQGDGGNLRHPYSKALHRALPQNEFEPIINFIPCNNGCFFANVCGIKSEECTCGSINMRKLRIGFVRCINAS